MRRFQADYTGTNWGVWGVLIGFTIIGGFVGLTSGAEYVMDLVACMGLAVLGGIVLRNGFLLLRGVASPAEVVAGLFCGVLLGLLGLALGPTQFVLAGLGGGLVLMMFGKLGNDTINNVRYVRDSYDESYGVQERRSAPLERRARAKRRKEYRRSYYGGMGRFE